MCNSTAMPQLVIVRDLVPVPRGHGRFGIHRPNRVYATSWDLFDDAADLLLPSPAREFSWPLPPRPKIAHP